MDNMIFATKDMFRKFFKFSGRLPRSGYWYAYAVYIILSAIVQSLDDILGLGFLDMILTVVFFVPLLSLSIRRLHDVGVSTAKAVVLYVVTSIAFLFFGFFLIIIVAAASVYFGLDLSGLITGFDAPVAAPDPSVMAGMSALIVIGLIFLLIALIISIYFLVKLCKKGEEKTNKYGKYLSWEDYRAENG